MTRADSNLTLAMKSGYTARVDADGNELRRLPDGPTFPTISGADFARVIHGPQPVNAVAAQIREKLSTKGELTDRESGKLSRLEPSRAPEQVAAEKDLRGSGENGHDPETGSRSTLPFVAGSATSEAAAASMAGSAAAAQQARVLAFLQACRYDGSTDLAGEECLGIDGSSYRPRRIRLVELGLVVLTSEKRLTPSGKQAGVYVAAEFAPPAAVLPPIPAIPAPVRVETPVAPQWSRKTQMRHVREQRAEDAHQPTLF